MKSNKSFLFLIVLFFVQFSFAQDCQLNVADDFYVKQNFSSAQFHYQKALFCDELSPYESDKVQFRIAFCSVELINDDAEYLLNKYLKKYPNGNYANLAFFELGRYRFIKKDFLKCIVSLRKVDVKSLTDSQRNSYYFRLGYSCFIEEKYQESQLAFYELEGVKFSFSDLVNYCVAHMNYIQGNYASALNSFYKLSDVPSLGRISKFYITHIYYFQSRYGELIEYAEPLLDTTNTDRNTELFRLVADAHYNLGEHEESIQNFEKYAELGELNLNRLENYQLAYSYTQLKNYESAVSFFEKVLVEDDSLSQFTSYHLGATYLELDDKAFALNSFKYASSLTFDLKLQEDAFFNYVKLVYDVENTYNNSVTAFKQFLDKYPDSDNSITVRNLLVRAYAYSRDYDSALNFLTNLNKLNLEQKSILQRVSYFNAIDFYNEGDLDSAIFYFDLSMSNIVSDSYLSLCLYWKGEALYGLSEFDAANELFQKFLYSSEAIQFEEFNNVHYALGYSNFQLKSYSKTIKWLRKFLGVSMDSLKLTDANLRIGDAYFMTSDYQRAAEFYVAAEQFNIVDVDYALYQQMLCYGLNDLTAKKKTTLQALINDYSNSEYMDDALLALSSLYFNDGDVNEAIELSNNLIINYPFSPLVKTALLKLGLHYYNTNQQDLAIKNFKSVIKGFPASDESKEALVALKNATIEKGDVQIYFDYINSLSDVSVSIAAQDSISYEAAESLFYKEDYNNAIVAFGNYINQFEAAFFYLPACYYLAESASMSDSSDLALATYLKILDQPVNEYTKRALFKVANIEFEKEQYAIAALHYTSLLDYSVDDELIQKITISLYQCYKQIDIEEQLLDAAKNIISLEKVSQELMVDAKLILANHAFENSEFYLANKYYEWISEKTYSLPGAESKYQLAYLLFLEENYEKCEEFIYQLAEVYSDDYYIAKGFILLSDVYFVKENYFQAKATLISVLENYEGDDLIVVANDKLEQIINVELTLTADSKEEIVIIDLLKNTEFVEDSLFDYDEDLYIENEE